MWMPYMWVAESPTRNSSKPMEGPVCFDAAGLGTPPKGAHDVKSRWPIKNGMGSTICSVKIGRRCRRGGATRGSPSRGPSPARAAALFSHHYHSCSTRTTTRTSSSRYVSEPKMTLNVARRWRLRETTSHRRRLHETTSPRPRRRGRTRIHAPRKSLHVSRESTRLAREPRRRRCDVARDTDNAPTAGRRLGRLAGRRRCCCVCWDVV